MICRLSFLPVIALALAGCGGGGGTWDVPDGKEVHTPAFETYKTDHNGYNRVRLAKSLKDGDRDVLAAFDSPAPDPEGYSNMVELTRNTYRNAMVIEVIAELYSGDDLDPAKEGKAKRLLRITTDQSAFDNIQGGKLREASGKYYFRGESYAWVTIDNGPLLSGYHSEGLENLVLDFDNETATINLRTGVSANSDVRIEVVAEDMPFNIRTGAYGGDMTVEVWDPAEGSLGTLGGVLRGNVGGTTGYGSGEHKLTTSGVYTAEGTAGGKAVTVDGIYYGRDPNVVP